MNFKFNKKGFSLIELLVAAGIFVAILAVVAGIFISEMNVQKKIYNSFFLQNEGNFLMQKISKEIRMLKTLNSSQENLVGTELSFENYDLEATIYCQSNASGNCGAGTFVARNGQVISSPEIIVERLKFITSDSFASGQPLITVILEIKSASSSESLMLQNSLAMRFYN